MTSEDIKHQLIIIINRQAPVGKGRHFHTAFRLLKLRRKKLTRLAVRICAPRMPIC